MPRASKIRDTHQFAWADVGLVTVYIEGRWKKGEIVLAEAVDPEIEDWESDNGKHVEEVRP